MARTEGEKLSFGFFVNKKRKESSKQPALLIWMKDLEGNLVEENPGAIWINIGDDCPDGKKDAAKKFIEGLAGAIERKWLKVSGSLKVQVMLEVLQAEGGGSSDPFDDSDDDLPF